MKLKMKAGWLLVFYIISSETLLAQTPLTTDNGVKANTSQYYGDLNSNQAWGGIGMSGMYIFNANTLNHAPVSSDWYHVIEMQHDAGNNWTGQIALGYFTDNLYYRQQNGANWQNWHTLATQDWIQSLFNTRLTLTGTGSNKDANGEINGDLVVRSNTGSRNVQQGAMLEFVVPANTDGSNPWGQGRIITVAGNQLNANATGKMILGTRRMQNKLNTGNNWYYGDDLTIDGDGNVGIGILSPTEKLAVNGNVRAKEIKVEVNNWPDYVFSKDYQLPSLDSIKVFINKNGRLPELPSAVSVESAGLNLGEINRGLVKKVEEMTLYLLEKQEQLNDEKQINASQTLEIKEMKIVMERLTKRLELVEKK
ncbi:hypothetical protein EA772_01295 [Pedobacter sp. G11]|uniref:pyocin knob domain-containing protein n=1 Tax=Pedobacter sp. G11 TaxID=2482728 RepID=UPI000F5E28A6|nr:pyocin knob domain-containing protein [Pedobacter sp. G11]AZI24043.1 hypothetical protein EA772_01295 [Pedobacter sp. G11]